MENVYDDFDVLVGDLKDYVRANPDAKIVENDDVMGLKIRYEDVENDASWAISIKDLNKWIKTMPGDKGDIIHRCFLSQEGKEALLDTILKSKSIWN